MSILNFLLVAGAVALADVCWTMYFIHTAKENEIKAGIWSAFIILCSSYATVSYVTDTRYIVAAMIGAFVGTWGTILYKKKKDRMAP